MMFSTSSPTYPASVSVVASAMVNGHVQDARQRLGEQRLPAPGGPEQEDVRLLQLHAVAAAGLDPLVVVIDGHGEDLLRPLLPDDVFVEGLA